MRKKKVEGEYQIDSWPKGPEWSLCPLARPDIAMGPESQIEAWSARNSGRLKTPGSHHQFASCVRRKTTASNAATTDHCLRDDHPAERRRGLGCQGQRHRGEGRNTLDIPLHRRNLWGEQKPAGCFLHRSLGSLPSLGMTPGVAERKTRTRRQATVRRVGRGGGASKSEIRNPNSEFRILSRCRPPRGR